MKILFYQNSLSEDEVVSDNVHILEVLNNLSRLGHTIFYADGTYHFTGVRPRTEHASKTSLLNNFWLKVKKFGWTSPVKGEGLILYYLAIEAKTFLSAFRTILRYQPQLIYRRHTMFNSQYLLSRIFKIPSILEVNGIASDEYEVSGKAGKLSLWLINRLEKYNLLRADKYIVVTAKLKELLSNDYKVPEGKVIVIENGANTDLFKPIEKTTAKRVLGLDDCNTYICFVGGLAIWHGVDYLLSAMPPIIKEYPRVKALVIGDGDYKNTLLAQSAKLAISDAAIFTGRVPYEKVPWYINASDICVLPSSWSGKNQRTGLSSLKLCEYLACGKPVVASRISGFEFIEEYSCGYLVEARVTAELSSAILSLLRNPLDIQRLGENGRKYVLENRSWESIAKKVATVCEDTLQESRSPVK